MINNQRLCCRVEEVLPFERQLLSHQFVAAVLRDMYGIQVCFPLCNFQLQCVTVIASIATVLEYISTYWAVTMNACLMLQPPHVMLPLWHSSNCGVDLLMPLFG